MKHIPIREMLQPLLVGTSTGLLIGIVVMDLFLPKDMAEGMLYAEGILYAALVMMSLRSPRKPFTLIVATSCSALILQDFYFAQVTLIPVPALANRFLVLVAIWVTVTLSFLRTKAEEDVTKLRALLPICVTCKKIRDASGTWSDVEAYLKTQADLQFSRCMCPDCRLKWAPMAPVAVESGLG